MSASPEVPSGSHQGAHHHDHAPVRHEGPQPVVYALQTDLSLGAAEPQSAEELLGALRELLGGLLAALRDGGCSLIGHVKGMVDAGDLGRAFFSVTSFRGAPSFNGSIDGPIARCRLTLNVIVFGIDESSVEAAVREALSLHFALWRAGGGTPH